MKHPSSRSLPADLAELQTRLERWRAERRRGEPIPPVFWEDATRLVRKLGVSAVSRALRLSYPQLKRRAENAIGLEPTLSFVALPPPSPALEIDGSLRIEVTNGGGAMLRLTLPMTHFLDPAALVHAFLRGAP